MGKWCHGSIYPSNTAKILRRPSKSGLEYMFQILIVTGNFDGCLPFEILTKFHVDPRDTFAKVPPTLNSNRFHGG